MSCSDETQTNLKFSPGVSFKREVQLKGSDGEPVDLTGCIIKMQVRERLRSPLILIELSTNNDRIVITDALNGIFEIVLEGVDLEQIDKSGVYDLEVSFPDGTVVPKVLKGNFILDLTVTRREP